MYTIAMLSTWHMSSSLSIQQEGGRVTWESNSQQPGERVDGHDRGHADPSVHIHIHMSMLGWQGLSQ
jgi:hypothetical protein